jgi:putative SOS response-associated peptidase YedK
MPPARRQEKAADVRRGKVKPPFAIRLADNLPFTFAALWEVWRPESGPPQLTGATLTTASKGLVRPIHDWMKFTLEPQHYAVWIYRVVQNSAELTPMLRPFAAGGMQACPVSP